MKLFEIDIFWITLAPTYYGLMYVLAFLFGIWYLKHTKRYTDKEREVLFLYSFLWVLLGGRIGYMIFYSFESLRENFFTLFKVWEWWMSFHGWFLWVCVALLFFSFQYHKNLWIVADDIAIIAPIGIFLGRIWNYLNKELLGFPYDGWLAVKTSEWSFFPSPLLEAFFEGIILALILFFVQKYKSFHWQIAVLFFIFYWLFRTFIELFVRTPDAHIWYHFWFLTQGSFLSIPMILAWVILYIHIRKKNAVT